MITLSQVNKHRIAIKIEDEAELMGIWKYLNWDKHISPTDFLEFAQLPIYITKHGKHYTWSSEKPCCDRVEFKYVIIDE